MRMRLMLAAVIASGVGALIAPSEAQTPPPDVVGTWEGKVTAGGAAVRIVVQVTRGAGGYTGTLDSPDQGAAGLPLDVVTLKGSQFRLELKMAGAVYEAALSADGSQMEGTWSQGGLKLPLALRRSSSKPGASSAPRRPQEPHKPYPYREESVTYRNARDGNTIAGTLTIPAGKGPFPAVLLIAGSGPNSRDEVVFGHKVFMVLADYLTRRGIAVLRADKRGIGASGGRYDTATSVEFASDAEAGVSYLQARREVNRRRVGLVGHSEGGIVAPMVATSTPRVAYIVLLAGTGVPGDQVILSQSEAIARAAGASKEDVRVASEMNASIYRALKTEKDDAALRTRIHDVLRSAYDRLPEAQRTAMGDPETGIQAQTRQVMSPWFRYFVSYDPRPTLRKVRCPVLVVNGEKDLQVLPSVNVPEIQKALRAARNPDCTVRVMPGLNHLFQTAKTGSPAEYGSIEETISPAALKLVGDWILARR